MKHGYIQYSNINNIINHMYMYTAFAECMQMCILRITTNLVNTTCCITHIFSTASFYIYFHILHLDINPFNKNPWQIKHLPCTENVCNLYIMGSVHNVLCQMFYSSAHRSLSDNPAAALSAYIDIH